MSRALPEWIGASPDTPVPPRVRVRIWEAWKGTDHTTGLKIPAGQPWALDHIVALVNGGENRESNLAPIAIDKHREKTARDVAMKSKTARVKAKHLGLRQPSRIGYRKFDGTPVYPSRPSRGT